MLICYFFFLSVESKCKENRCKENRCKENRDKIMCVKLDYLSKLRKENLYELFKEEFFEPPINIHRILDRLGVEYNALDFSLLECQINNVVLPRDADLVMGAVAAHSIKNTGKDAVEITVNIKDTYHRQRFTLAHELAHCMLHANTLRNGFLELRTSITDIDPRERAANILAGEILIPEILLKKEHAKLPILQFLANKFDVSENVMAARLEYLDMEYYEI